MEKIRDLRPHEVEVIMQVAHEIADLEHKLEQKKVEVRRVLLAVEPEFARGDVEYRDFAFWRLANSVPDPEIQGGASLEVVQDEE